MTNGGIHARAAVVRDNGLPMTIEKVVVGPPGPGEVLIEIVATGICHTDMVMRDGHLPVPRPVVLGHEGAGQVIGLGDGVTDLEIGDAVILSFASCGHCPSCDHDSPGYCHEFVPRNFLATRADGTTAIKDLDGAPVHSHVFGQSSFATHAIAPRRNVVKVDPGLPLELLGPLGCGVLTGAGTVLKAMEVEAGSSVLIIGAGAVGLSAVMAARIAGAGVIVAIDRNAARVELARELGATHGLIADGQSIGERLGNAGLGLIDYAIDTTGHTVLVEQAVAVLAPRGQIALVAAFAPGATIALDAAHIMSAGRVVRGIVEGSADPQTFIPELLDHYRNGRLPLERLVRFYDFDDILSAIAAGETGEVVKPVVLMTRGPSV